MEKLTPPPFYKRDSMSEYTDAPLLLVDLNEWTKLANASETALRTAREGLFAAAAVVEPRSPAFKLIEQGLKAVNGVVGEKEARK